MNRAVVISVLVICCLIFGTTLLLYYTQPFTADYVFKEKIEYKDITINTVDNQQGYYNTENVFQPKTVPYVQSAEAIIGEMQLENNGMFTQVITLPNFVGCLVLTEKGAQSQLASNPQVIIQPQIEDNLKYYYGYAGQQQIEIAPGKEKTIALKATYNVYLPVESLGRDNFKGLAIFELPMQEENPLYLEGSTLDGRYYSSQCAYLQENDKPHTLIQIV